MSRRKFLHEINRMTRKGVYPSLRILLEEDEENKDDDAMGGDNPFGDDDSDDSSDSTPEGGTDSESEGNPEDIPDDTGMTKAEEDDFNRQKTLSDVENTLTKQANVDSVREKPTAEESQLNLEGNMFYSFKEMALINEETDIDSLNKKVDAQIKSNKEKYRVLDQQLASSSSGVDYDIDELVDEAVNKVRHFNYDEATIVAKLMFMKIRSSGKVEDIEQKSKEFASKFYQALKQNGIDHALPDSFAVNSIDNTSYNTAQGAKSQG